MRGTLRKRRVLESFELLLKLVLLYLHVEKVLRHPSPLLPMTIHSKGLPLNPSFQSFQLLIRMGQLSELPVQQASEGEQGSIAPSAREHPISQAP